MNILKKSIILFSAMSLIGCATLQTIAIPSVISAGLKYGITDSAKRTVVADYIMVVAVAARSVSKVMTPEELTAYINSFIPDSVRSKYPEIEKMGTPIVVAAYKEALDKYGSDIEKIYPILNQVAGWLEAGAAPYITQKP